ncbi:MAG: replication initiation factor domain-containing protein [Burkholderiales bacterium]|nr:replication initiation factor domain-containing protein [Burkholderiales bacterium]
MTRISPSALVLDGGEVKLRLQAERVATQSAVHVDWVRFTCFLRNVIPSFISSGDLYPMPGDRTFHDMPSVIVEEQIRNMIQAFEREHVDPVMCNAMEQARSLALEICEALGPDFSVHHEIRKGHDFYRYRWSIVRNEHECGWVGFLASGDSPRQEAQASTIHANLYGAACTFARTGWNDRIANIVDMHDAKITRADLALDFFDGYRGGMDSIVDDYKAGAMNVRGNKPKCNMVGDWCNGAERSFYFGSKEAGKQTNAYEKGHQLFGPKSESPWIRFELRYGNKLRVLSSDMLRRPADFFAGASDWHALVLSRADAIASPEPVKTTSRLAVQTVKAEVSRNVRWMLNTASQSIATAFRYLSESEFLEICDWNVNKLPGRLRKFSASELQAAFAQAFTSSTSQSAGPAFAMA